MASWETGQVLDVEVLSKCSNQCQEKECPDTSSAQSLEWWSWLPGRPDRCWMWRCSASAATSARRRSVLTPHRLSFWSGGRGFLGDRTGAGCGGAQQVLQPVPGEGVS